MTDVSRLLTGLFRENYGAVYRQLSILLGHSEQAYVEDLVQQAFLRLYAALIHGKGIENPRAWVFATARHLAIDHVRARTRMLGESAISNAVNTPVADGNPEEDLLRREELHFLRLAVQSLPTRERACLKLRARGLTYKEIAEVLGISVNSVGPTLAHALRKLKVKHVERAAAGQI